MSATTRGSGGVLDLRERHRDWYFKPAKTSVIPHEQAERHGSYDAILRDGMVVVESRPEGEDDTRGWRQAHGTYTRESLRRLRDAIDELLRE